MSARKKSAGPDMGALKDDWDRVTRLRQEERTAPAAEPAAPEPPPAPPEPAQEAPVMSRRSWYAEQEAVEALAAAVDDIHFATRVPKHQVVSELFRAAAAAAPEVQTKLNQ